jgi:hypothetical protein
MQYVLVCTGTMKTRTEVSNIAVKVLVATRPLLLSDFSEN